MFAGEVALVTGAASGIGRACVDAFLERGAAVVGLDIDRATSRTSLATSPILGVVVRRHRRAAVADARSSRRAARSAALDMLVLNAGVFRRASPIAELDADEWRR